MAYISQEEKKSISVIVKEILKKYNLTGTLSIENHSTLNLKITKGSIDFIGEYMESMNNKPGGFCQDPAKPEYLTINRYWMHLHFEGKTLECLNEIHAAMKGNDYYDESDAMTDYFHIKHYFYVHVGTYGKPYVLIKG